MLEEQTFTIETPEHVEIVYTVAGPGSRLLAFLLDFLVMLVPAILLVLLLIVIASAVAEDALRQVVEGSSDPQDSLFIYLILAFVTMAQFLISQFYFVVFELAWNGQSPGKRWQRIRVIMENGQPVGFFASMIRNLLRIADLVPLFYLAGFISMLATRHWKRLGDLAAGSIVVKVDGEGMDAPDPRTGRLAAEAALEGEAGAPWPPRDGEEADPDLAERFETEALLRRDPGFFDVAERYLERRHQLEPIAASALAEKIARPVMERLGVSDVAPDRFLEQAVHFKRGRD
jgi:uncharacterized RDD family membrane protein YckC